MPVETTGGNLGLMVGGYSRKKNYFYIIGISGKYYVSGCYEYEYVLLYVCGGTGHMYLQDKGKIFQPGEVGHYSTVDVRKLYIC